MEVAGTTLAFDRTVKVPLYARAGVPEVWLVDLADEGVEAYRRPAAGQYTDMQRVRRGQRLACDAFSDLVVAVDEILG